MMWQWTAMDVIMLAVGGYALAVALAVYLVRKIKDREGK